MAAVSPPRPDIRGAAERAAWVSLGIALLAIGAFVVPTLLGLLAAAMFHVMHVHAGRLPIPLIAAVDLAAVAALAAVVVGALRVSHVIRAATARRTG
jgi:hypothetical protein